MKKVLFAASECVPFIKTGGLADVCGTLPGCFDKSDWDIRVVIPDYTCIPDKFRSKFEYVTNFYMGCGPWLPSKYVGIFKYEYKGITYYFIDNEEYFNTPSPYTDNIRWDIEKFIFFDKAVLSMLPIIGFRPDIIHCHDWETGMIPVYVKNEFAGVDFYQGIKTIMTIHNLKFQGVWDIDTIKNFAGLPDWLFTSDKLEYYKAGNMFKGGLAYADKITTVSRSYALEIQTPQYGEGLDGLMFARRDDLTGIVNGVDYDKYNPEKDPLIFVNYTKEDWRQKKFKNKLRLQEELGLVVDKSKFMIGLVSRLTSQKGIDLVLGCLEEVLGDNVQFVVIGTGEYGYEEGFRALAAAHPECVSANICYDDTLADKLYAAADAFLMPSLFEPCGLTQLMSFAYGTVPIVRETGGLRDTVEPYNEYENTGTGFSFMHYDVLDLKNAIEYAKRVYFKSKRRWNEIVDRGMAKDFSWDASAVKYRELYESIL